MLELLTVSSEYVVASAMNTNEEPVGYAKPKTRGKNEEEIFKNYMNDVCMTDFLCYFNGLFENQNQQGKNDLLSERFREEGNKTFSSRNNDESFILYNQSVLFATHNSEYYAKALGNRSAVLYNLKKYKLCLEDAKLCLKCDYPSHLKPKIYLRMANCYKHLGESDNMRQTANELLGIITNSKILAVNAKKYKDKAKALLSEPATSEKQTPTVSAIPTLPKNSNFPNASINIKQMKNSKGSYVIAKTDIPVGDILFVEKPYTFFPLLDASEQIETFICQYCLKYTSNIIPCKECVKQVYCTETCRDSAWNEFHQWECYGFETILFKNIVNCFDTGLAFRTLIKTANNGSIINPLIKEEDLRYLNRSDEYERIFPIQPLLDYKELVLEHVDLIMQIVHYLKLETDFFTYLRRYPTFEHVNDADLTVILGALLLRYSSQIQHKFSLKCNFLSGDYETAFFYPCTSTMSHSCDSNTTYYFEGDTIIVKASKNIKAKERVTLCYIPNPSSVKSRNRKMRQNVFNLKCDCTLCLNPHLNAEIYEAFICMRCGGPACKSETTSDAYACLKCFYTYLIPVLDRLGPGMCHRMLQKFSSTADLNELNAAITVGKAVYSQTHMFFQTAYVKMARYYYDRKNYISYLDTLEIILYYKKKRFENSTIDYIRCLVDYCSTTVACLAQPQLYLPRKKFIKIIGNLKHYLNVLTELSELHYPPLLKQVEDMKAQLLRYQEIYNSVK